MVSHLDQSSRVALLLISCDDMAPTVSKILDIVADSAERYPNAWKPLCKNFRNSTLDAAAAGGGFLCGNVVGGPVGGLVGGVAGVVVGVLIQENGVEPLPATIANMTAEQRQELASVIAQICKLFDAETELEISTALSDSPTAARVAKEASRQLR